MGVHNNSPSCRNKITEAMDLSLSGILLSAPRQATLKFEMTSFNFQCRLRSALDDLGLESIDIVHAGDRTFPLAEKTRAVAFSRMFEDIRRL